MTVKAGGDGWAWQPVGGDVTVVRLTVGDQTYCAEFGGIKKVDEARFLSYRKAPAPVECQGLCGDGVVTSPEQCGPPDGISCNDTCQNVCPPDASSILVDCVTTSSLGIALAANGPTFALAYSQSISATETHTVVKRLDSTGHPVDPLALQLSVDIPDAISVGSGRPAMTPLGGSFYAVWPGGASFDNSFFQNFLHGRTVPLSGAISGDVDVFLTETPFGQCSSRAAGPVHVTSNLAETDPRLTWRRLYYCTGSVLFETLRINTDGSLADASPFLVASTIANAEIGVAAGSAATLVGFTRTEASGLVSIRVAPLP